MKQQNTDIKKYWDERAEAADLKDAQITHSDTWQRWLEIESVKPLLRSDERVIDIGCGTGYATRQFAPLVSEIVGTDYSEPMIEKAKHFVRQNNTQFRVANILNISPRDLGLFDLAISMRCLINLDDWELQKKTIDNISKIVKPGGRFLMIEGCAGGRKSLDDLRVSVGLKAQPKVWHNLDFEADQVIGYLSRKFVADRRISFGTYDFISRVVHPLMVAPEEPSYLCAKRARNQATAKSVTAANPRAS